MSHRVTLIPGDGIGPEVAEAARVAVSATGVVVDWDVQEAGASVIESEGTPLPDRVLASIRVNRNALKGPVATPVGGGFRSVNVTLRQRLDLFASVRPLLGLPGIPSRYPGLDLMVVRENTEDLYAGIEFERGSPEIAALAAEVASLGGGTIAPDAGVTVKPISVSGTRRIARFALDHAARGGRRKVTVGHKAAIMRFSDGLFLSVAATEAAAHPDIEFEEMPIDEMAMTLVSDPGLFDVLLLPNLYGDIVSDLGAGLVGGLGLAPGANLGWEYAVFEPVHGSAPDIAGQGLANPVAIVLSAAMMLDHLSERRAGAALRLAVAEVVRDGPRTRDLGGAASTSQVAEAIAQAAANAGER